MMKLLKPFLYCGALHGFKYDDHRFSCCLVKWDSKRPYTNPAIESCAFIFFDNFKCLHSAQVFFDDDYEKEEYKNTFVFSTEIMDITLSGENESVLDIVASGADFTIEFVSEPNIEVMHFSESISEEKFFTEYFVHKIN